MRKPTASAAITTIISSNGSKWAGEAPDPIEKFLAVLNEHPLDRLFEGDDCGIPTGMTRFWGNFLTISHVFQIDTTDPVLIDLLTAAIRANQRRPDYLAQPDEEQRRAAIETARQQRFARHHPLRTIPAPLTR